MKYTKEEEVRDSAVMKVAELMCIAARTAPKGKGVDNLFIAIIDKEEIKLLSQKMEEIGKNEGIEIFVRDSASILKASALVLIGSRIRPLSLNCGFCGFVNCDEKNKYPLVPCMFNTIDLGIAIGSAVSVAMEHKVDNRILFTAGYAALRYGLIEPNVKIACGIPLSVSSKNPFFDRKL